MFDQHTPVGDIATAHPLTTRVFARHRMDFCCGGRRPLAEACAAKGLAVDEVLRELQEEMAAEATPVRWDREPLDALIDHILVRFHAPLTEELPRLEAMARKVHRVHHDKAPAMLDGVLQTYLAIKADIEQHLPKEEQVLFPLIKAGRGPVALAPMSVMEAEHDHLGALLTRLREVTEDYTLPEGACTTWRALWAGLEALEHDTHLHIHLENNVLHPRARVGA